jgi:GTP-binding protein
MMPGGWGWEPCPVSAEHGGGMLDLRDAIVEAFGEERCFPFQGQRFAEAVTNIDIPTPQGADDDDEGPEYDETKPLRVAIVGRPNAGKSTLINQFLGQDRLLTGPEAGITRDSIAVDFEWQGARSSCSTPPVCAARPAFRKSSRSSRSPMRCAPSALPKWW